MNTDRAARKYGWAAAALIAAVSIFRLFFITRIGLAGDEAYYWVWSQNLDLSYYSKGPGVAWVIACGTALFGNTVFGIRFWSVVLSAGTGAGLFWLGKKTFGARVGFWSVVVASVTPLFVIGGLVMTIDPISVFFWTMAALAFYSAKDSRSLWRWALVGLLVGLGMLAKYTNVAQLASFALFCIWSTEHRHHFRRPTFWVMCLVAVLCLAPVLVWNSQHDWITFTHLKERGALDRAWRVSPVQWMRFIGDQLGVVYPPFLIGIFVALFMPGVRRDSPVQYRFLASLFVPLFLFYSILALNDSGEANWTAPSLIGGLVLMTGFWCRAASQHRAVRLIAAISLVVAGLIAAAIPIATTIVFPEGRDPLRKVRGAQSMTRQVEQVYSSEDVSFIIAGHYETASLLRFYNQNALEVYTVHSTKIVNQYAFWPSYDARQLGNNALFVSKSEEIPVRLSEEFQSLTPLESFESTFKGSPVRRYYVTLCRGYRGPRAE